MIISIASGKGGTGKTTVAVCLAKILGTDGQYLDCDVEEPNGHIFFKPDIERVYDVSLPVPEVDKLKCTLCGRCQEVCLFNALVVSKKTGVMFFPELCHSCGACSLFCPIGAILETPRKVGIVRTGNAGESLFADGMLNVGEHLSPPVIKEVLKNADDTKKIIVDSPPGTSCPVVETVRSTDFCVLVTEPTPFGLNDLRLAVDMLELLKVPCGVVINRSDIGDDRVEKFCKSENIPVLAQIPHDVRIAKAYSQGQIPVESLPEYRNVFENLMNAIEAETAGKKA